MTQEKTLSSSWFLLSNLCFTDSGFIITCIYMTGTGRLCILLLSERGKTGLIAPAPGGRSKTGRRRGLLLCATSKRRKREASSAHWDGYSKMTWCGVFMVKNRKNKLRKFH